MSRTGGGAREDVAGGRERTTRAGVEEGFLGAHHPGSARRLERLRVRREREHERVDVARVRRVPALVGGVAVAVRLQQSIELIVLDVDHERRRALEYDTSVDALNRTQREIATEVEFAEPRAVAGVIVSFPNRPQGLYFNSAVQIGLKMVYHKQILMRDISAATIKWLYLDRAINSLYYN